jgi:glyoxylase-like metal-dependent hydrolase (beta-lactamase superfamily II)
LKQDIPLPPPHSKIPAPGKTLPVADGIRWIRMPLPFALNHVNLWLLQDLGGWVIVDTGYGMAATQEHWNTVLRELDEPITRILVTHCHPDHVGLAAWLQERTGAPVSMTLGEFFGAQVFWHGAGQSWKQDALEQFRLHGLAQDWLEAIEGDPDTFRAGVPALPRHFQRLLEGDLLEIGGRTWAVHVGHGHSPEHAGLHCEEARVFISGDMVLPTITTNVSVQAMSPKDDPLARYLASLERFRSIPDDTLLLPSHGRPFRGLHQRLDALGQHHADRLRVLEAACQEPCSAADILQDLFDRALDSHQLIFAMGEAIAHLHHLEHQGRLRSTLGSDGILRFQAGR